MTAAVDPVSAERLQALARRLVPGAQRIAGLRRLSENELDLMRFFAGRT